MSVTDKAQSILRKSDMLRINFQFPSGGGPAFVFKGQSFSKIADRMGLGPLDPDQVTIRVIHPKTPDEKGEGNGGKEILLTQDINGRETEATVCHESGHLIMFRDDLTGTVFANNEEAACYIIDACYYQLTAFQQSRWAVGPAAKVKIAAAPIARAILQANTSSALTSVVAVSGSDFANVLKEVQAVYTGNSATRVYPR